MNQNPPIVVFCHLRWEFVTQRPQHIINRLAKDRPILFVEDPIGFEPEQQGTANSFKATDNITVIQPRINNISDLGKIVNSYINQLNFEQPILWFYSPAFIPALSSLPDHSLIIYDCMDELSGFKGASPELINQEKQLLEQADVVFTGGKSLYESKKRFHAAVYCFPSSVDRKHFEKVLSPETTIPADVASLPHPIAGYYGVIDERLDLELLARAAQALPNITFLMIGPVVKISEEDLPRAKNLVYTGSKPYEQLPAYLKAIDIAMMPFALNAATEFISPTKTLEFMAAYKPIVSTPIRDVVSEYSREVAVVKTPEEFAEAIEKYVTENPEQTKQREQLEEAVLQKTSWDQTVSAMKKIIEQQLEQKQPTPAIKANVR